MFPFTSLGLMWFSLEGVSKVLFSALLAFLALPGLIGVAVTLLLAWADPWRGAPSVLGAPVIALGAYVLLWTVRDFYAAGRGTLAPWQPPKQLVVVGLYRYCRNPMYVGVIVLIAGWSWTLGSPLVGLYVIMLSVAFHLRVVRYEEPRTHKVLAGQSMARIRPPPDQRSIGA